MHYHQQQQQDDLKFGFNVLTETKDSGNKKKAGKQDSSIKQLAEQYTNDALILQFILEYSIEFGTSSYFTSRELSKNHLLINCKYFKDLYQDNDDRTKIGARAENINDSIVAALQKLEYLELVCVEPYVTHNKQPSEKYKFTQLGKLVALLISYKKNKMNVSRLILNISLFFTIV